MVCFYFSACYFFQAEDGIRDGHVTGVQTCALPICGGIPVQLGQLRARRGLRSSTVRRDPRGGRARRSEERRVGKEGLFRESMRSISFHVMYYVYFSAVRYDIIMQWTFSGSL